MAFASFVAPSRSRRDLQAAEQPEQDEDVGHERVSDDAHEALGGEFADRHAPISSESRAARNS